MEVINWVKVMLDTTTTVGDGTSLATCMILLNYLNGVVRPGFPNVLCLWLLSFHAYLLLRLSPMGLATLVSDGSGTFLHDKAVFQSAV